MTPEEITKLAEEYAEDAIKVMASDPDLPASDLNGIKRDLAEYTEKVIRFILRTHCIVSKEKVRAMMSELDNDIKTSDTLKFADTPVAQLQKGRMQGYSIGAKMAISGEHGSLMKRKWTCGILRTASAHILN